MKTIKKILIVGVCFFGLLVAVLAAVPFIWGDDLKAKMNETAAKYVKASIKYDDVGLSIFSNFPNVTASVEKFAIIGRDKFEGDTLIASDAMSVEVDIMSFLGDKYKVKSIELNKPLISLKVLADSSANYDIMIPQPEDEKAAESAPLNLSLENWQITEGTIRYKDATTATFAEIINLNHQGSGDINADIYDLVTKTQIDAITAIYDNTTYLKRNRIDADMVMEMNMKDSKYTFKENKVKLNDLAFQFDGFFQMPAQGYVMDMKFEVKENSFKNMLSLIPAVFMQGYENIEAEGNLAFSGFVKGTYDDTKNQMPAFNLKVLTQNAKFKYPNLPTAVTNINVDMEVDNKDGNLENTVVDIRSFRMNIGSNPIDGKVKVKGMTEYLLNADVNAKIDLAEMSAVFPIEGTEMKGKYTLNLKANGTYSEAKKTIPQINAVMNLQNGYVKSKDYPFAMENITLDSKVSNQSGVMADTQIDLQKLGLLVDGSPFEINGHIENLEDYTYDLKIKGILDLEKMTKIYPLEGMTVKGIINADIATKGKMSDVDASRYDKLPTSGTLTVQNLEYTATDMPQGMKITEANVTFTPQKMNLNSYKGFLGKSDIALTGFLNNYLAYGLHMAGMKEEKALLVGNMTLTSQKFDTNEWMSEEETPSTTEESYGVIELPTDVDFTFNSTINEVMYEKMTLNDMKGIITMKEGVLRMSNLAFGMVGGKFVMSGLYDPRNVSKPAFDFSLNIAEANIGQAFQTFNTVQTLAPAAKSVDGNFTTNFAMKGILKPDMMPDYATLTGAGLIKLQETVFKNEAVLAGIATLTGKSFSNKLKDIIMQTRIEDGKMNVAPFDVDLGDNNKATIQGYTHLDGRIDYTVKLDIPKAQIAPKMDSWFGVGTSELIKSEKIILDVLVKGNYAKPEISLDKKATQDRFKGNLKEAVTTTAKDAAQDAGKDFVDKIKNDTTNRTTTEKAKDAAKDIIKNAGDLKDKLPWKKKGGGN